MEKEISEVLLDIAADLKRNNGEPWDLTNDSGEPTVFDTRSELYIRDIVLDKDNNPCALIPLGHFEDDTIRDIAEMMRQDLPQIFRPSTKCSDPDQLQFFRKISVTKFWYCEPNIYHNDLLPDADTPASRLREKYLGDPEGLLQDAHTDPEVHAFLSNSALWLEGEIDADSFSREQQEKLLKGNGYSWNFFACDMDRNQIICEIYFEENQLEFRNDI
ncbi:hypothetical protein [Alistipes indistinctus]|uniref:hypothetical protein n=1 Tax=Alistipes indistinctus TaxID=626932 RepID=UPI003A8C5574